MKRNTRVTTVHARALTDPNPMFVSLVKGGANQRPFRAVRMDPDALRVDGPQTAKEYLMPNDMAPDHDIAALKFSSEQFPDEKAVKAWLDTGGYSDVEITKTTNGFEVQNTAVEFEVGSTKQIEGAVPGLTVYVARLSQEAIAERSEAEKIADHANANASAVAPVDAPAKEETAKEDAPAPEAGDEDEPVPAVEAEAQKTNQVDDSAAPEPDAQTQSDMDAMIEEANVRIKGMYATSLLSYVLADLSYLVKEAEYSGTSETTVAQIKTAATTLISALTTEMMDTTDKFEEAFRGIAAKHGLSGWDDPAPASTEEETTKTSEPDAAPSAEGEEVVPDTQDTALLDAIKALTSTVGKLAEGQQAVTAKVDKMEADINGRVEAVERTTQTRKGADASETDNEASPTTQKSKGADVMDYSDVAAARRRFRAAMGASNPA